MKKLDSRFHEHTPALLLDKHFGRPMWQLSFAFASLLALVLAVLEFVRPWHTDIAAQLDGPINFGAFPYDPRATAWSPILSGLLIGTLQIPAWYLLSHHVGTSTSYVVIVSRALQLVDHKLLQHVPYFANYFKATDITDTVTLFSIVAAAVVSSWLSGERLVHSVQYIAPLQSFIGGFLALFGARLAGGCTSGHGISG
jgi:uncharacterized membrane protein YedE/YeeE